MIGRLRPGATIDGMDARLTGLLRQWMQHEAGYPSNWMAEIERTLPQQVITVVPAGAGVGVMKEQYGRSLQILLGVCALVLLIACANVANLLLARAVARRGQTAVRLAMGASRRQILTEALVESVLLAIGGAIAGLIVAAGAARLLLSLAFAGATIAADRHHAVAAGARVRDRPGARDRTALRRRTRVVRDAHRSHRGAARRRPHRRRSRVVRAQGAARGAGHALRGARGRLDDAGPQPGQSRGAGLRLQPRWPRDRVRGPAVGVVHRRSGSPRSTATWKRGSRASPACRARGWRSTTRSPNNWGEGVLVAGKPLPAPGEQTGSSWDRVSTNYLQQLGVKLVRGRYFTEADNETSENVAIVNEAFVKRFFKPEEDPLDQHFGLNLPENVNSFRIVGVVGDARFAAFQLDRPMRPMFFVPLAQTVNYANEMMKRVETASHYVGGVLLVTNTPPGVLEPQVARALAEADPNLAVITIRTLAQQVERTFDRQRAVASLAGMFGVIALILAAIGLYGVTAYSVARRTSEIGVRMALGADRGRVMSLVLGGAFKRVAVGLVLGLPLGGWRRLSAVGAALRRGVLGPGGPDRGRRSPRVRGVRRVRGAGDAGSGAGADEGASHRVTRAGRCGPTCVNEIERWLDDHPHRTEPTTP